MLKPIRHSIVGLLLLSLTTLSFAAEFDAESMTEIVPDFNSDSITEIAPDLSPDATRSYALLLDKPLSSFVGADALISTFKAYQTLSDKLIPSFESDDERKQMGLRALNFLLIESTLTSTAMVTQHEFFGHGARAREFHIPHIGYQIRPWSGFTTFPLAAYNQLAPQEQISLATGGIESTAILASSLRAQWLHDQNMNSGEANLYFSTLLDQTNYVLGTGHKDDFNNSNDINSYISSLNQWYGQTALTLHTLKNQVLVDFLDPYLFYSVYSMGNYIINGQTEWTYPMIPIGNAGYLPGFRSHLAPYGVEYEFLNYIKTPEHTVQASLRHGKTLGLSSYTLSLAATNVWEEDKAKLDAKIHLWRQPKLLVAHAGLAKKSFGSSMTAMGRYYFTPEFHVLGHLGYKTKGYLPGESLKAAPILRLGVQWQP